MHICILAYADGSAQAPITYSITASTVQPSDWNKAMSWIDTVTGNTITTMGSINCVSVTANSVSISTVSTNTVNTMCVKSLCVSANTARISIQDSDIVRSQYVTGNTVSGNTIKVHNQDISGLIRWPVNYNGSQQIYMSNHSGNTVPASEDGFMIRWLDNLFASNNDGLQICKTDGNSTDPDGGIQFTMIGNDGISEPILDLLGSKNVRVTANTTIIGELNVTGDTVFFDKASFNSSIHNTINVYPSNFTLKMTDNTVVVSGNAVTISLPQASTCTGITYNIKNCATDSTVTIDPYGSEMIDGKQSLILGNRFDGVGLISNGSQWWINGTYKVPPTAHGNFSDSTDQAMGAGDTPQIITFNTNDDVEGLYHNTTVLPGRFTVLNPGAYQMVFSGIADSTLGNNKYIAIWLRVNGIDVPRSNTIVTIPTAAVEQTVAVAIQYHFNVNDYFELWTYGTDVNVRWNATAAGVGPACPSVILTVAKVSD